MKKIIPAALIFCAGCFALLVVTSIFWMMLRKPAPQALFQTSCPALSPSVTVGPDSLGVSAPPHTELTAVNMIWEGWEKHPIACFLAKPVSLDAVAVRLDGTSTIMDGMPPLSMKSVTVTTNTGSYEVLYRLRPPDRMRVISSAIVDGKIALPYGKHGTQFLKGMPSYSLPVEIAGAPKGTKSYAIFLDDPDSIPVCRFAWIHWAAANLTTPSLEANASINANGRFVQGVNSCASPLLGEKGMTDAEASHYVGMAPPDTTHTYVLRVYALDAMLPLKDGFFANEMFKAMEGHVLATGTLKGSYPAKAE